MQRPTRSVVMLVASAALFAVIVIARIQCADRDMAEKPDVRARYPAERGASEPMASTLESSDARPAAAIRREGELLLYVRDLGTGDPVADLELTGSAGDTAYVRRTDARGRLTIPPSSRLPPRPIDGPWRFAAIEASAEGSETLWLTRSVTVRVHVHGSDGDDRLVPTEVALRAELPALPGPEGFSEGRGPWNERWMFRNGLLPITDLPSPDEGGYASLALPQIVGLTLTATSPGWRRASARVPVPARPGDDVALELTLTRRSVRLTGFLRTEDGKPITRCRVMLYVTRVVPLSEFKLEKFRRPEHGFTAAISEAEGYARVTWILSSVSAGAQAAVPGGFAFEVDVDGEAMFVALPEEGLAVARRSLGPVEGSIGQIDVRVARPDRPESFILTSNGVPLTDAVLVVSDMSSPPFQLTFSIDVGENGRVISTRLERGRRYNVSVLMEDSKRPPVRSGYVTWTGQKNLAVEDFER